MRSVHRNIFKNIRKSEGGFIFIAAIMSVMILMAVGFFALTITSQDIRISSRLVGERKALSAAESCVHYVCAQLDPNNLTSYSGVNYDTANPTVSFSTTLPSLNKQISNLAVAGYDLAKGWTSGAGFNTVCTGGDASYNSRVNVGIGTTGRPVKYDLQYPD
jgi:Tfp pilus assembly protein PilX